MSNVPASTPDTPLSLVSSTSAKAKSTTSTTKMPPSSCAQTNDESSGASNGAMTAFSSSARALFSSQEIFLTELVEKIKLAISDGKFQIDSNNIASKLIGDTHDLLNARLHRVS